MNIALATALVVASAVPLQAQLETIHLERINRGEPNVKVNVEFGGGHMLVAAGAQDLLFSANATIRSDAFSLRDSYNERRRELEVYLTDWDDRSNIDRDEQSLDLFLSPEVPSDVSITYGIGELDLDLSGVALSNLELATGASATHMLFSSLNPVSCGYLNVKVGAAAFEAEGLGNSRCRNISLEGRVTDVSLDFSGDWNQSEMNLTLEIGLTPVELRIPENVGVTVDMSRFLMGFEGEDFERREGRLVSSNYGTAQRHLRVQINGVLGKVKVVRIEN